MASGAHLGDRLALLRREAGLTQEGLAERSGVSADVIRKLEQRRKHGARLPTLRSLADGLGVDVAALVSSPAGQEEGKKARNGVVLSGAVRALQTAMAGDPAEVDIAADGLDELVRFYANAVQVTPSAGVYAELISARTFAGALAGRIVPGKRTDIAVSAGWLSSLLAVSAADLGDHAAAVMWCADAERRARDADFPELLGWPALTRAMIAYYQGDPARSVAAARMGQAVAPTRSAVHVKLAAQEMRSLAMLGDFEGMASARRRAAAALGRLVPGAVPAGVYVLPRADDLPYTATSLLLAGRYREAAVMTRGILGSAYGSRPAGGQPTNYARTLLILALAAAGLGDVDEAAATGTEALDAGRVVWPTMVLAGRLARQLDAASTRSPHASGFRERYADAGNRLALSATLTGEAG